MYKLLVLFSMLGLILAIKPKKTDCEEHREREQKSKAPLPMRLIPECDSKGDYKPLQCFQNSKFCSCWDKAGNPLTQPSGKIKACDCIVKQKEAKPGLLGAYKAQCEEDGKYKKEQCHGSTGQCWCVDPVTGVKKTEPKKGKANCR